MTDRSTALERLTTGWQSDLEVLDHWGHGGQSRIVALCRETLLERIEEKGGGRVRVSPVLAVWESDADVLEAYGHPREAEALRRCVEELRTAVTVGGADSRGDGEPPASPPGGRPRRPRSRVSNAGGDSDEVSGR